MINLLTPHSSTHIPSLEFTPRAADTLKEIRRNQHIPEEYHVRLGVNMRPKQRYEYLLDYSKQEDGDTLLQKSGIACVIETHLLSYFDNVCVDFTDSLSGRGFMFLQREENVTENVDFPGVEAEELDALQGLQQVFDPELNVNIVDVGLLYSIVYKKGTLTGTYTLSTKNCPMADIIREDIKAALTAALPQAKHELILTYEPEWSPARITPKGKILLQR